MKVFEYLGPEDKIEWGLDTDPDGGYFDESLNESKPKNEIFPFILKEYNKLKEEEDTVIHFSSDTELDEFCSDNDLDSTEAQLQYGEWILPVHRVSESKINYFDYKFKVYDTQKDIDYITFIKSYKSLCDNYTDLNKEYMTYLANSGINNYGKYIIRNSIYLNDVSTDLINEYYTDIRR